MNLTTFSPARFRLAGMILSTFMIATILCFASDLAGQDKVDFAKDIKPIFDQHCVVCHGPVPKEDEENEFRIDDRDDALDWVGEEGPDDSDLFQLLISDDEEELMPPPEHSKLTALQISLIKNWIEAGAEWPEDVKLVDTSSNADAEPAAIPVAKVDPKTDDKPAATDDVKSGDKSGDKKETPVEKKANEKTQQIFDAIASLHPAAVHLPIGLLLASGLFALFSLRGNFVMSDCAYYCLWLGTLGAIAACVSGWYFSPVEHKGTVNVLADLWDQTQPVFWHRTGGLIVTIVSLLLALFAAGARNRDPDDGVMWKLGLILLACGIGWVGHTGGELHYGAKHYKALNAIFSRIIGSEEDENGVEEKAPPKPVVEKEDNVGKSSDESKE